MLQQCCTSCSSGAYIRLGAEKAVDGVSVVVVVVVVEFTCLLRT